MFIMEKRRMKFSNRGKNGQFVILSAVIIATFTLSLVLSIHQISINNQQLNYNPVEELVLGITSDLDRCLTHALSIASQEYNATRDITAAEAVGNDFIARWASSIVGAYSNIGLRFDLKKATNGSSGVVWEFNWGNSEGESYVFTQFSMDIDAYGFKGWTYYSQKYVSLWIDNSSITLGQNRTSLKLTVEEGKEYNYRKPVQDLTPEFIKLTLSSNDTGVATNPNIISLVYLGQGEYILTFDDFFYWGDNLTISVMTPTDRIIVEAYLGSSSPSEWTKLYLSQQSQGEPVLVPTRITGKGGQIQSNFTQSGHDTMIATSPPTPFNIRLANVVNITLWLEVSQNQSPVNLTVTLAFEWNGTIYTIGSDSTKYLGSGPYIFQIDAAQGEYPYGVGSMIVPSNSTIILIVEAIFERQPYGRLFLNYGPDAPSNVELF